VYQLHVSDVLLRYYIPTTGILFRFCHHTPGTGWVWTPGSAGSLVLGGQAILRCAVKSNQRIALVAGEKPPKPVL
jgi:hypothetical protein